MNKYKLIIASTDNNESVFSRNVDSPVFVDSLEKAKKHLETRKKDIAKEGRKLWFYKVWEHGHEEYEDMENVLK